MYNWKSALDNDCLEWLLEEDNPSARYYTLTDLLEKQIDNSEVMEAKEQIMKTGPVPKILEKQNNKGYWEKPERFYSAKYKGTVWQLMILAELGANENDERIKNACEFILSHSQDAESGGFAYSTSAKKGGGGGIAK